MTESEPDFGALARAMRRTAEKAEQEKRAPTRRGVVDRCRASDLWTVEVVPPVEHTREEPS